MHNDGVVQGVSGIPFMQDYKRWGILTIGTGLGNACFTIRKRRRKGDAGAQFPDPPLWGGGAFACGDLNWR
jgi:hypothetical protein